MILLLFNSFAVKIELLSIAFLDSVASSSAHFSSVVDTKHLDILESNGSLKKLGSIDIRAGAAVFFEDISLGLGVRVSGLMSSILAELQIITLAFECVPLNSLVGVYSDSQAVLNACKLELGLIYLDFRNHCWIECQHIHKMWSHSGVVSNKHADALANTASFFSWYLIPCVDKHYILADGNVVFEVGSGSRVLDSSLHLDVDWFRSSLVWHPDLHMAVGFTSRSTTGVCTYFMKALHHWLLVAVRNVLCLYCGEVEVSDHAFSCTVNDFAHCHLLNAHVTAWSFLSGHSASFLSVSQLLFSCASNVVVCMTLCKGFIFKDWLQKAVSVFGDAKIAGQKIVEFVHNLCLAFSDKVWLVYAKHCACMEKSRMILSNSSTVVSISGLPALLSAGVVKLLDIAEAIGVGFGFYKSCLFFSGIRNSVLVYIGV
ncbi:hypothetical protein G9A89_007124 [Geosiphon pyriformis]|nr:hypothetical protein G9A89_007124 [Geosiphon pyriformis]